MGRGNRGRGRPDHPEEDEEMYEEEMEVSAESLTRSRVPDPLPGSHGGKKILFFVIGMPVFEGEQAALRPRWLKAPLSLVSSTAITTSPWSTTSTTTTRKS